MSSGKFERSSLDLFQKEDESVQPPITTGETYLHDNVSDFGSWALFGKQYASAVVHHIDYVLVAIVTGIVEVLFFFLAVFGMPLTPLIQGLKKALIYAGWVNASMTVGGRTEFFFPMAFSVYHSLEEREGLRRELMEDPEISFKRKQSASTHNHNGRFSSKVARLLLILSTLAYQPENVLKEQIQNMEHALRVHKIYFKRTGSVGAYKLLVRFDWDTTSKPIVVVVFKGTSPFDLTEWLVDFSFSKLAAPFNILPGMLCTGFFNAFGWPNPQKPSETEWRDFNYAAADMLHIEPSKLWDAAGRLHGNQDEIVLKYVPNYHLWVTGHSLGGATSSLFAAMLNWTGSPAEWVSHMNPAMNPVWGHQAETDEKDDKGKATKKGAILHGLYTFGQPRVGDSSYKRLIAQAHRRRKSVMWRVSNVLDLVPHAPPGDSLLLKFVEKYVFGYKRTTPPSVLPFNTWGSLMIDYEHVGGLLQLQQREMPWFFYLRSLIPLWDHGPAEYLQNLDYHRKNPNFDDYVSDSSNQDDMRRNAAFVVAFAIFVVDGIWRYFILAPVQYLVFAANLVTYLVFWVLSIFFGVVPKNISSA